MGSEVLEGFGMFREGGGVWGVGGGEFEMFGGAMFGRLGVQIVGCLEGVGGVLGKRCLGSWGSGEGALFGKLKSLGCLEGVQGGWGGVFKSSRVGLV